MAKSKIKTHKMASVQRKTIQDRRIANWNNHESKKTTDIIVKFVKEPHSFTGRGGEYEWNMVTVKRDNAGLNRV